MNKCNAVNEDTKSTILDELFATLQKQLDDNNQQSVAIKDSIIYRFGYVSSGSCQGVEPKEDMSDGTIIDRIKAAIKTAKYMNEHLSYARDVIEQKA